MNQGFNAHHHKAGTEAGQTSAPGQEAPKKEREWVLVERHHHFPNAGALVEFVTKFGEQHFGLSVAVSQRREHAGHYGNSGGPSEILLQSESDPAAGYFTKSQIEKWRITEHVVPKKRLLGITHPGLQEHQGMITPLFTHYVLLRLMEKLRELSERYPPLNYPTSNHFQTEDMKNMYETFLYFGNRGIRFVEVQGDDLVTVTFEGNGSGSTPEPARYDFRHVQAMAEDVCDFMLAD